MIFASRGRLSRVSAPSLYLDASVFDPDAITLDVLARIALAAKRVGYRVILYRVSSELEELIELAGLSEVLPIDPLRSDSTPPRC
jgi:anti-anti-sigma regulatory factor